MKKYHVISAKNFGYESNLGDKTWDYFVFPVDKFSKEDVMALFKEIKRYVRRNNDSYPYKAYKYLGKIYYSVIYSGVFDEDHVPFIP